MVLLQVADVDGMFSELDELRRHNWNIVKDAHPVSVSRPTFAVFRILFSAIIKPL